MDRQLYKKSFKRNGLPQWKCPTCEKGVLQLEKDSFSKIERSWSREAKQHDAWEPEWIESTFSCMLKCANRKCQEGVALSGIGNVAWDIGYDKKGNQEQVWDDVFRPKYFWPPLKLIEMPKTVPENVSDQMSESFELFFANPPSSANHVRIALEFILTDLKVKRFNRANGRQSFLSLHQRIERLTTKHTHLKELCLAVKWLGNAGSHSSSEVSMDDVMDAYEIVEVILQEIYDKRKTKAKKLAKTINKKKGPQRKKR